MTPAPNTAAFLISSDIILLLRFLMNRLVFTAHNLFEANCASIKSDYLTQYLMNRGTTGSYVATGSNIAAITSFPRGITGGVQTRRVKTQDTEPFIDRAFLISKKRKA
jgi:hypothetical protein